MKIWGKRGEGVESIKEKVKGKIRVLWGDWGVGKWRVMNGMVGEVDMKRGGMWGYEKKGMERSSFWEMFGVGGEGGLVEIGWFRMWRISW